MPIERPVEMTRPIAKRPAAPAPDPQKPPIGEAATDDSGAPTGVAPKTLLREASLKTETREVPVKPAADLPRAAGHKSAERPVTAAKPVWSGH